MKNKINELRLSVGTTPDVFPQTTARSSNISKAIARSADSVFSSHLSKTFTDEDKPSEEDEMEDSIFRKRVKVNGSYDLNKTLERLEEFVDLGDMAGDALASITKGGLGLKKMVANAGKSLVGSIPVVDVIFGSYRLSQLAAAIRNFSEAISETMNMQKGAFGNALKADSDSQWKQLMYDYAQLTKQDEKTAVKIKNLYNEVLENLKDFVITLVEAYDTIAQTIITLPTGGTLTLPAIAFGNIGTGITGFAARTVPFERVLFSGGGYIAEGLNTLLDLFLGNSENSKTLEKMGEESGTVGKIKKSFNDIEQKGGSVMSAFLFSPLETLARLNEFYRTTGNPDLYLRAFEKIIAEDKKYSILFLLETVSNDNDVDEAVNEEEYDEINLEEFTTTVSIGGGPALPLGLSPKYFDDPDKAKAIAEQREWITRLQSYHQKTTNKLK